MIARWDRAVVEAFQDLHWGPANWCFEHLSDWWVKSLVIIGIGLLADVLARRPPFAAALAAAAYFVSAEITDLLKDAFGRLRPPAVDPAVHPLVVPPTNGSMPSSHASTAFAAAVAVGLVHPRLRFPLFVLAVLIAVSRVWLGVHFLTDVLVGAALGTAVALGLWVVVRPFVRR